MSIGTHSIRAVGVVLLLAAVSSRAFAGLLAVDTFNYAAGTGLNGLNGGTGWGGAWVNTDSPWTIGNPGLSVTTPKVVSPDNAAICASTGGNRSGSRPLPAAQGSGVVYVGMLLSHSLGGSHYGYASFVNGINYGFKIGWSGGGYWNIAGGGVNANTWGTAVNSAIPVQVGVPVLAVMKMDISNKTGYLYINQAAEGTPDAVATASRCGVLTFWMRGANNGASTIDDVRVGTTYADVVVIPKAKGTIVMVR